MYEQVDGAYLVYGHVAVDMHLGTYIEHNGRPAVRFERTYAHPIERVWAAVSDPIEMTHWFPFSVTIEARTSGC
jgi:hypothetical protein